MQAVRKSFQIETGNQQQHQHPFARCIYIHNNPYSSRSPTFCPLSPPNSLFITSAGTVSIDTSGIKIDSAAAVDITGNGGLIVEAAGTTQLLGGLVVEQSASFVDAPVSILTSGQGPALLVEGGGSLDVTASGGLKVTNGNSFLQGAQTTALDVNGPSRLQDVVTCGK